jgi:hypothetical protein
LRADCLSQRLKTVRNLYKSLCCGE